MWGLYHSDISGYDTNTLLMPLEEPSQYMIPIFLSGIFSAIIIFLCSLISLVLANNLRKNRKDSKIIGSRLIVVGLLLMVASIIYTIAINITMSNYIEYVFSELPPGSLPPGYITPDFWDVYSPGFAIIMAFIGSAFIIIAGIASVYVKPKEEEILITDKKELIEKTRVEIPVNQNRYCPECGQKLLYKESRYCSYCGFDLKS